MIESILTLSFQADFGNRVITKFSVFGEPMDLTKHTQGTEVKAITMHNLQINESEHRVDVYILLDIWPYSITGFSIFLCTFSNRSIVYTVIYFGLSHNECQIWLNY